MVDHAPKDPNTQIEGFDMPILAHIFKNVEAKVIVQ